MLALPALIQQRSSLDDSGSSPVQQCLHCCVATKQGSIGLSSCSCSRNVYRGRYAGGLSGWGFACPVQQQRWCCIAGLEFDVPVCFIWLQLQEKSDCVGLRAGGPGVALWQVRRAALCSNKLVALQAVGVTDAIRARHDRNMPKGCAGRSLSQPAGHRPSQAGRWSHELLAKQTLHCVGAQNPPSVVQQSPAPALIDQKQTLPLIRSRSDSSSIWPKLGSSGE